MSDNVNVIVQDTINEIIVNSAVIVETIDINVQAAIDEVTIISNPNEYIINVNRIIGEQVQSDWDQSDDQAPDYIKNKPTIPAAQVNSDWNATTGVAEILNKPTIPAAVTKTSDLTNDGEDGINPFITLADVPPVTGFVPYTGATQDVNLGEFGLQTGNIEFDLTPTNAPTGVGSMVWNDTAGTLDLKLKGGAVTLQIGQETVARVVNKTATNITLLESNYQIVRVTGAQGQRPKVDLALANNDLNSTTTLGLVTETILNNEEGFITTSGQVQEINTTGSLQGETWVDGDVLYLSGTVAGRCTNIKPIAPIHTVIIGFVEYAHAIHGKIFVKVDNGYELEELHNVSAIAPNNNEVLTYDTPTLLWKPKTIATILGYTPFQLPALTSGSVLFSNGTTIAQDNANFFWDNTNKRLNIGGTASVVANFTSNTAAARININNTNASHNAGISFLSNDSKKWSLASYNSTGDFTFYNESFGNYAFTIKGSNSNVLINTTTDNGGKLQIKATGALSTDIALRVRNSADTANLMTLAGNGLATFNSNNIYFYSSGANQVRFFSSSEVTDSISIYTNGGAYGSSYSEVGYGYKNTSTQSGTINFDTRTSVAPMRFFVNPSGASSINAMDIFRTGSVGIGTLNTEITSAILSATSTTRGFLPPRMTTTQKNAIATPASGLVVYDTTLGKLCVRGAAAWETITSI